MKKLSAIIFTFIIVCSILSCGKLEAVFEGGEYYTLASFGCTQNQMEKLAKSYNNKTIGRIDKMAVNKTCKANKKVFAGKMRCLKKTHWQVLCK